MEVCDKSQKKIKWDQNFFSFETSLVLKLDANRMKYQEFDALYDTHKTAVFSFAYSLTQNRGEAEDLFQETWLRVAKYFPKVLDREKVKAWLFTITANLHRDALRRKRTRRRFIYHKRWTSYQDMKVCDDSSEHVDSDRDTGFQKLEMSRAISQAVSGLPDQHRLVFMLKEIAGFKQSEISEILGIPVGTVKSVMFRAVKKLRQDLAVYHPKKINQNGSGSNELQRC
jgi:RNA polymerase sigma-70 factor (ECF subfamily)